ncbi:MAG TPA: glucose-1-phosphate thymidylyltransferase [Dehalococcoidia bacterium]|nr:glucose-1-phosphate thymidylyltransferase [Dehalococcoidia bacterium]
MKALILCGGKGTRLMPLTRTTPKHLLPVANKPTLFYLLEQIKDANISDIGIVVCPETGIKINEAVGDGSMWSAAITYINQPQPLGLAHAVKVSQGFLGEEPFLMLLGDNLIDCDTDELIERFEAGSFDALITLKEVKDPSRFGVAEVDDDGKVIHLDEKPREPKSRLAIVGGYVFSPKIHQAIMETNPSSRRELEITDAIQKMIEMGGRVTSYHLKSWWYDIGTREGLLEANGAILNVYLKTDIKGSLDKKSKAMGRVTVKKGTTISGSIISGPVSIGEGCRVKNSLIGPFVSVGNGVVVEDSSVEHSIILDGCHIYGTKVISNSVIGRNTRVKAKGNVSGVIELLAGDSENIVL